MHICNTFIYTHIDIYAHIHAHTLVCACACVCEMCRGFQGQGAWLVRGFGCDVWVQMIGAVDSGFQTALCTPENRHGH